MENEPSNQHESLWRRKLTGNERAELRAQPGLEAEARLTDALTKLSDAPVPSNFTARVMDAIDREERAAARSRGWQWNWRSLFPRLAVSTAVLIFAGMSIQRYEVHAQRQEMARTVAMVATSKSQPSVDALADLDAIRRMSQSGHADSDLLADLQ
jgi:hypothetical protein